MGPTDASIHGRPDHAGAIAPPAATAARKADRDAPADWAQLRRRMIGLAVKLVWNRDDAEEIVQEAFRVLIERSGREDIVRRDAWLMRTVSGLCLNHRRRRPIAPLDDVVATASDDSPSAAMARAEQLVRTRSAIESLPPQQRLALVLRTMEGLSFEEAAGVMELTPAAVRTHVHLARRRLTESMAAEETGSAAAAARNPA